jgi:hypothetical protein
LDNNYSKIIFKVALEKDIISEEIQKEIESEQAKLEIDKAVKYFEDNYLDHK